MTVAVIDTGIDQLNPALTPYVIPGYDFTRNTAGFASDVEDLNQSTAAILEQSTAAILEQYQIAVLNQSTAAILEQSTAAILEANGVPAYFGHGTMTAGLIHLVAPNSQLMPLKAFAADGTASEANIIQAIYYAVDHGANIINMSFELPQISDAMMKAINHAARRGVICVASAGNDAGTALVYPAGFGNVVSVGSVNSLGQPSTFSNYGADLVQIAAPGEGLITTYPGSHYAQVWGTSFSAALVSGGASVLIQQSNGNTTTQLQVGDIQRALSQAIPCGTNGSLGAGCVDFNQAVNFIKGMNMPKATATSTAATTTTSN
ncbi:MAG: S8 family serine peptidase [Candidatus Acidiferrales bacterium]